MPSFLLPNYSQEEDFFPGYDFLKPKKKPLLPVEPPPETILDKIKQQPDFLSLLSLFGQTAQDPIGVGTGNPNWAKETFGEEEKEPWNFSLTPGYNSGLDFDLSPVVNAGKSLAGKALGMAASPIMGYFGVPGVASSIPGRVATGLFGASAAKAGGEELGTGIAEYVDQDKPFREVSGKVSSGLADLLMAPAMMKHAVGKGPKATSIYPDEVKEGFYNPELEYNPNWMTPNYPDEFTVGLWQPKGQVSSMRMAAELGSKGSELPTIGESLVPELSSQAGVIQGSGTPTKPTVVENYVNMLKKQYNGDLSKMTEREKSILDTLLSKAENPEVTPAPALTPTRKVEADEPIPGSGLLPEDIDYIRELSEVGMKPTQIAKKLGLTIEQVMAANPVPSPVTDIAQQLKASANKVTPAKKILDSIKESKPVEEPQIEEALVPSQSEPVEGLDFKPISGRAGKATKITKGRLTNEEIPSKSPKAKIKSVEEPNEKNFFDDLTDLPKTLRAAVDISFPGRQGLFLLNRPTAVKAMARGTKGIVSHQSHLDVKADLESRPNAKLYEEFGLNQVERDPTEISGRNEEFPSTWAEKIPGIAQSERAYTDAGNLTRADMFDSFAEKFMAQGKTPENRPDLYKGIAKYLNVLTGRDPLPEKIQAAGWLLNKAFWSPMFVKSRAQLLNPVFYAKLPREMQLEAIRDVGGTLAVLTTAIGAVKAIGGDQVEVETDPRHTDFGKVRVGKTSYDFFSGLLPLIRLGSRIATGEVQTRKGDYAMKGGGIFQNKEEDLPQVPFGGRTAIDEALMFTEGKASPLYGATKSKLEGVGYGGEKYELPEFLRDIAAPMSAADVISAWRNWDMMEGLKALPAIGGVGVDTDLPDSELADSRRSGNSSSSSRSRSKKNKYGISLR